MRRALVVDDEMDICLMVTKYLQNVHFEADYALSVKEAFVQIKRQEYELMFIDLNLTDGSGFDVINYIYQLNLKSKVIVISAYDSEAEKAQKKGANLFIAKPFTIKILNEALSQLNFLPK